MNAVEGGFQSLFQAIGGKKFLCVGNPPPTALEDLFDAEFLPVPGLFSLVKTDFDCAREGIRLSLEEHDRLERRALELELDLCGCLDSRLP